MKEVVESCVCTARDVYEKLVKKQIDFEQVMKDSFISIKASMISE